MKLVTTSSTLNDREARGLQVYEIGMKVGFKQ